MAFPFSSPTVGALIEVIDEAYTHADLGTLLFQAGADGWDPPHPPNKHTRLQQVFRGLRGSGGRTATAAALELVRLVLAEIEDRPAYHGPDGFARSLIDALAADGWEYDPEAERLVSAVPGVDVPEETGALERELRERGWTTAAGHYRQALDAFGAGNWASANAQVRSLLEDVLPSAAHSVTGKRPREVQAAIDQLQARRALVPGEVSFLKGLWSMAQHHGSHPGLSDRDEARFRLMTVTAHCRYLLVRLPQGPPR